MSREQGNGNTLELAYEKRKLAGRLGMTPENLSRSFLQLSEHGVASRGRRIEITDRKALAAFAAPDELLDG
jgi:CRP/FNR family transcriptional activator FtrB